AFRATLGLSDRRPARIPRPVDSPGGAGAGGMAFRAQPTLHAANGDNASLHTGDPANNAADDPGVLAHPDRALGFSVLVSATPAKPGGHSSLVRAAEAGVGRRGHVPRHRHLHRGKLFGGLY